MLRFVAAGAIGLYQRHLSPRKGYACAWRVYSGRCSCSQHGKRLVLRAGVRALPEGMRRQFARCRGAYLALQARTREEREEEERERQRRRQQQRPAGSSADCVDCDDCSDGISIADCLSCDADACEIGDCGPD